MLERILFIVVVLFCVCCKGKKQSINLEDNIEVVKVLEKEKEQEISKNKKKTEVKEAKLDLTEWELLDNNVFETIDEIKISDNSNRKELLQKFTSFLNKTDGATSEGYFGFAYDYPKNNFQDFFSVLKEQDSVLMDNWAKSASMEIKLVMDNLEEPDTFFREVISDFQNKTKKIDSGKKKVAEFYLNRLIKHSNNN